MSSASSKGTSPRPASKGPANKLPVPQEKEQESGTSLYQIGKFIASLRQERGITQAEFAAKLGTTQSAIARIELGEQNVSTEMLAKIGDALNRDVINLSRGALNIKIEG